MPNRTILYLAVLQVYGERLNTRHQTAPLHWKYNPFSIINWIILIPCS